MTTVITYGTFDLLHWGHIRLLERAAAFGDELIVGLSTDEFNAVKHKEAYHSYEHRKYILEAIRYVDKVIPEKDWDQKIGDVQKYHADVFVMGDDWAGKFDFLKPYCQVIYLPRTKGISTTKIKTDLSEEEQEAISKNEDED
ncbi:glycerol-3-phosphate cytidylyltransferase [Schleiferilactobacillus shenzhenensis]|uniref:TagD n=1 Tax=Schleiferilactobacillus shenzhenensis LY-73 TaxID=1231336 RepID=U4TLA3_9LACO|nr:glycerol-3-phosphate cytidylyltransferase [Schleiferilactobacillus shenzhenensis]ERL64175.1 TagD [Schleiferilactobacillus shenzhenensis LY-73]